MHVPDLELLWWEGCPSTDRALDELRTALAEVGLGDAEIRTREIENDVEAKQTGFRGSPTILIDGVDWAAAANRADGAARAAAADESPSGLTCRIYRRRDGRISPLPDPDDLRQALRAAAEREEVHT
jgi:TPP-dependent pyruvate/acetoin dehydrogenase alpha subunit